MQAIHRVVTCLLWVVCAGLLAGCGAAPAPAPAKGGGQAPAESAANDPAAEIAEAIGKLSPEDQLLAKAQGYCAVSEEPLGSMGPPVKLTLNDQPVFVCCEGCNKRATSNPDATVAKAGKLRARVKSETK
ncbi:MAG: hypothetical protein ACK50P_13220 [Planctomycetaceae bacterium]|jgi:hypothetical protein